MLERMKLRCVSECSVVDPLIFLPDPRIRNPELQTRIQILEAN
jgi:hypothetical protein